MPVLAVDDTAAEELVEWLHDCEQLSVSHARIVVDTLPAADRRVVHDALIDRVISSVRMWPSVSVQFVDSIELVFFFFF
jgi:hypothetical protein